ncbi:MAG: fatty acid desaturase [Gemmataceae bacterium]|nr:fatty acid desaturase [Gemmataceae bacterium]
MAVADLPRSLSDPALKARLQDLRRTDNFTNWLYLGAIYLYLAAVIGGAVWLFEARESFALSWWWNLPVALVGIVLVGAGQHQLSGLAHEGSHHILFRGRVLNDLSADLLTMFPLFSSIYHYRLQHLAHHQFVNDPDRDPDLSQMKESGHWHDFPIPRRAAVRSLLKQLWVPRLVRFMRVRANYNATGTDKNPYMLKGRTPSKGAVRVGVVYLLALVATLTTLFYTADVWALAVVPAVMWLAVSVVFLGLPDGKYHKSRLHPVIHARYTSILRVGYITAIFTALTIITKLTGAPAVGYYVVLWLVPLFTSFAFFMILRQVVQHGNGGRGWLTNTRTFLVAPAVRLAVFPMGQDYHLPHHLYATVPHYRLRKLHALLMEYPEYREQAVVVEGYFAPPRTPRTNPTVIDVLGPVYAFEGRGVHIDDTVMDGDEFEGADELRAEGDRLRSRGRTEPRMNTDEHG